MFQSRYASQDVFILGAGFSKAISAQMPVLRDLRDLLLQRLQQEPDLLSTPFLSQDLELALSFLSMRHPWLDESAYLRNRSLALRLSSAISEIVAERTEAVRTASPACPLWLLQLVHWMHERQAVVITLNYDTLLESAFGAIR